MEGIIKYMERGWQMMNYRLEELLPIVAELAERYTAKESTSISYDRARTMQRTEVMWMYFLSF